MCDALHCLKCSLSGFCVHNDKEYLLLPIVPQVLPLLNAK